MKQWYALYVSLYSYHTISPLKDDAFQNNISRCNKTDQKKIEINRDKYLLANKIAP